MDEWVGEGLRGSKILVGDARRDSFRSSVSTGEVTKQVRENFVQCFIFGVKVETVARFVSLASLSRILRSAFRRDSSQMSRMLAAEPARHTHTHTHPHKIKIQHFLYDQSEKPKKKKGLEKLSAMLRDSPERFPAILRLPTVLLSQPYNGYAGSILIRWGSYNLAAPIEADAGDDPATTWPPPSSSILLHPSPPPPQHHHHHPPTIIFCFLPFCSNPPLFLRPIFLPIFFSFLHFSIVFPLFFVTFFL